MCHLGLPFSRVDEVADECRRGRAHGDRMADVPEVGVLLGSVGT